MAKRKAPSQLVSESISRTGPRKWFDRMSAEDQAYIREVAAAMRRNPNAAVYTVAKALKRELGIDRNEQAIVATLKELINEA